MHFIYKKFYTFFFKFIRIIKTQTKLEFKILVYFSRRIIGILE